MVVPERPVRGKTIVCGIAFWFPLAGVTYQFLHYMLGLRRLGFDVYYVANLTTVGPDAFDTMRTAAQRFAQTTGRVYRETNNRFKHEDAGLEQTLRANEQSDLVISSRFHGCVIGLAMGRPTLAVSGDRKIDALMHDAGLGAYLLDRHDLADLSDGLLGLEQQEIPRTFLDHHRAANLRIAARVRALITAPHSCRVRLSASVGPTS